MKYTCLSIIERKNRERRKKPCFSSVTMVTAGDTWKPVIMGRRLRGRGEKEEEGAAAAGPTVKEA